MNIRDLLRSLRIPFREHGESPHVSAGWVGLICPMCGRGSSNYGLGIHTNSLAVNCWKCGKHGLRKILKHACNDRIPKHIWESIENLDKSPRIEIPVGKYTPPYGTGALTDAHRDYLRGRGFDPDYLARTWEIGGIGQIGGHYAWRICIPVRMGSEMVSWTTRAIGDVPHTRRYRSAPNSESTVPVSECLYGEHFVRNGIVIVEGPTGCWRIGPGTCCTCGLGFSRGQIARIGKYPVRALIFDNEIGAQRRASQLADELSIFPGTTAIVQISASDTGELCDDEVMEIRREFLE